MKLLNETSGIGESPPDTVEDRWQAVASPTLARLEKFARHSEVRALGLGALSLGLGLWSRGAADMPALQEMLIERLTSIAGVDTGPTNVHNVITEAFSQISFVTAVAVFGGGQLIDRAVRNTQKRDGVAELPQRWRSHLAVVDPQRLIFDAVDATYPQYQMALLHDGSILREGGHLEGGQLMSGRRRHLNALGTQHLSDPDYLSKARPANSHAWIVNLWHPDSALYSAYRSNNEHQAPLSPAKANNMLLTLSENWSGQQAIVIAPQNLPAGNTTASNIFAKRRFPKLRNVQVYEPEAIIGTQLAKFVGQRSLSITSDIPEVSAKFSYDMRQRCTINDEPGQAAVNVVYCSNDDEVILRCQDLTASPNQTVVAFLERSANVQEARVVGAHPWLLPDRIAQSLPVAKWQRD